LILSSPPPVRDCPPPLLWCCPFLLAAKYTSKTFHPLPLFLLGSTRSVVRTSNPPWPRFSQFLVSRRASLRFLYNSSFISPGLSFKVRRFHFPPPPPFFQMSFAPSCFPVEQIMIAWTLSLVQSIPVLLSSLKARSLWDYLDLRGPFPP